jgi:hypothetical protein
MDPEENGRPHRAGSTAFEKSLSRVATSRLYQSKESHAMAGKYFLATLAQSSSVLLQALLNCSIIAQLLTTKSLRIASAGLLLLWRAEVPLCKGQRRFGKQKY